MVSYKTTGAVANKNLFGFVLRKAFDELTLLSTQGGGGNSNKLQNNPMQGNVRLDPSVHALSLTVPKTAGLNDEKESSAHQ
jgi:hypothetical protein